ncbi:hypothetical protein NQ317_019390 [Molorchus minor]|uniref:RING-type E3 ubiquitin transferase n=1 Tax=Molorchus minor TaxID=1323400 RepID=A0ABQ9JDS5_9CUCU|nr:hypothetical protein NQ317_019390 [Molorchus minor]
MYPAKVADVLRLSQRDEIFVHDVEDQMSSFFKLMGPRNYHNIRKIIPVAVNAWYYYMTSFRNLQTLGEEYTGTIRVDRNNKIPSKPVQALWMVLFIGGEPLLERFLEALKNKISKSVTLTENAKSFLFKCIDFTKDQKSTLARIHHSLFYIDGKYYNISNRVFVSNIQWLQDDTFTGSFNILGHISLFYILFNFIHRLMSGSRNTSGNIPENIACASTTSTKICVLCADTIKSPCATYCGHIFCWNCIYDSLKYQKFCPVCRENINSSRIVFLQNYA